MKILVFAPHPDDEILGCGGTLARYVAEGAEVSVCIVTSPLPPVYDFRMEEGQNWPHIIYPEIKESHGILGIRNTIFLQFPCVILESVMRHEVNGKILEVMKAEKPDVVFIPHFGDMQKDHRVVAEAVMVAVRPKYSFAPRLVYSFECLSETEWNIPHGANAFIPNTYVNISEYLEKKIEAFRCYRSQLGAFPDPRSPEAVEALARLRGSTAGFYAAEAFALIREYRP
ncbi:MAG: PIG-L family deacetylase [Blautia sp.]|nr:PIG-L family deacetylase [Blautia sp.]